MATAHGLVTGSDDGGGACPAGATKNVGNAADVGCQLTAGVSLTIWNVRHDCPDAVPRGDIAPDALVDRAVFVLKPVSSARQSFLVGCSFLDGDHDMGRIASLAGVAYFGIYTRENNDYSPIGQRAWLSRKGHILMKISINAD